MKVTDQLNRTIEIPDACQRIVSLVPSQTELLVDLGLEDRLVGVTKFCIHPKGLKQQKTVVGGTKNFHLEKIKALNPDLILGNKEENYKEGIEELAKNFPVWMSDIITVKDAQNMITSIGEITQTQEKARELNGQISTEIKLLKSKNIEKKKVLYFIWKNPYMVAGSNNYINEMLWLNGYENCCNSSNFSRYPELTEKQIKELAPQEILLSSEPFPFKEKHFEELQLMVPNARIKIVDGELYSWYGSRLLKALTYFNSTK